MPEPPINRRRVRERADDDRRAKPVASRLAHLHRNSSVIQAGDAYERVGVTFEALQASGFDPPNKGALVDFWEAVHDFERAEIRIREVTRKMLRRERQSADKRARWQAQARKMAEYRQVLNDLVVLLHARLKSGSNCP
jgi:hypothetical protein